MNELASNFYIIASAFAIVIGAISTPIVSVIRAILDKKRNDARVDAEERRHEEISAYHRERNRLALDQTIKLDYLDEKVEMSNGFKTIDRVRQIKHTAYGEQKLYFIKEMASLFYKNNITDIDQRIGDIRVIISKTISSTDKFLAGCIHENFLAPTDEKIKFVKMGSTPEKVLDLFFQGKYDISRDDYFNLSSQERAKINKQLAQKKLTPKFDLWAKLGDVYDFALGEVKDRFYDNDGRVKK